MTHRANQMPLKKPGMKFYLTAPTPYRECTAINFTLRSRRQTRHFLIPRRGRRGRSFFLVRVKFHVLQTPIRKFTNLFPNHALIVKQDHNHHKNNRMLFQIPRDKVENKVHGSPSFKGPMRNKPRRKRLLSRLNLDGSKTENWFQREWGFRSARQKSNSPDHRKGPKGENSDHE
jgi:hypothetical protein